MGLYFINESCGYILLMKGKIIYYKWEMGLYFIYKKKIVLYFNNRRWDYFL